MRKSLAILREGDCYTKNTCIAKHIHRMLVDEDYQDELKCFMLECESPKLRLLWEILFETGIRDVELLEERIYQYGSMVKEQDYLSRELFVGLISLLNYYKKRE